MKSETLQKRIVEAVRKKFGDASATVLSEGHRAEVTEVIPTGIEVVDRYLLGVGGLAVGKLHEVYGSEAAGKSAFAYRCLAGAQRDNGTAVLVETEEALTTERAQVYGVDTERLIVIQPLTMEDAMQQMEAVLHAVPANAAGPLLLAWDSIAATPTAKEVEDGTDAGAEMGERARMLSRFCRLLIPLAQQKRAALLFINQTRQKVGVMYGNPTTTPGGNAVKFHAHWRMELNEGKSIKDGDGHVGKYVRAAVRKSRFTEPHRHVELRLDFATGWNDSWSTVNYAKEMKVIEDSARGEKALVEAREKLGWQARLGEDGAVR